MKSDFKVGIMLSVIIPTCNRYDSLLRAIYSVLNQNCVELEIIVVNDAEIPLPSNILTIALDNPVHFFENTGAHSAANARNYGVAHANGKYITFLDDDDIYLPGRCENILTFIRETPFFLLSSGRIEEENDFRKIYISKYQRFGNIKLNDILYNNDIDIGFVISKNDFIKLGGFDSSLSSLEDWDFILRALSCHDAYKLERYDYAVNIDGGRDRVSSHQSMGYISLAKKHRERFGEHWFDTMIIKSKRLNRTLGLFDVVTYSIRHCSVYALKAYISNVRDAIGSWVRA
ncbi:glycosyltransferase family 2 protein [Aeromonas veronii]|uniref:glycosyltransferase family 2 protein n=1 Tax=Aeromonas veronii TaxID=654 RepID=UPI002245EC1D|nr:glycosyltransferase family 2 protein [Aeromonas veronii]MCX0437836.1 glycosyltransferase [Aeromonas veronii]